MPLSLKNIPEIVVTTPCGTLAPWSMLQQPSTGRAPSACSRRRQDQRARQAPISRPPSERRIRPSRPAPAPPVVDVRINVERTGAVLVLRVPQSSSLDCLRARLPPADAARGQLAMADDSVEQWALESHFHAFLARAHKDREPLRLVLQESA